MRLIFSFLCISCISSPLFCLPKEQQVYQRDQTTNTCTVSHATSLQGAELKVYADGQLEHTVSDVVEGALSADVAAGLIDYKFEVVHDGSVVETVDRVACGDTYLIYGQSNAEAGYGAGNYTYVHDFIRTYRGSWAGATSSGSSIGVWGMHLARLILESQNVPVCIINGARGNTSIDELSPEREFDPDTEDKLYTETQPWGNFYKRLKSWATEAEVLPVVRGLLWHQGEKQVYGNDYGSYYQEFLDLRTALRQDYPSLEKIFMFQVQTGCGGGSLGWSIIFEDQRKLAVDLPDVECISTLTPDVSGCHYGESGMKGYEIIAEDVYPLLDTSFYGGSYGYAISSPNVLQVAYTTEAKDEILIQFDQPVDWNAELAYASGNPTHELWGKSWPTYLKDIFSFDTDPQPSKEVTGGRSEGTNVYLELSGSSEHTKLAYPTGNLQGLWPGPFLTGSENGIGAIGFYLPISDKIDTTVGKVLGCMDPNYQEFNPLAEMHVDSLCKNVGIHLNGGSLKNMITQTPRALILNISFSGFYQVEVLDIQGQVHRSFSGGSGSTYRIPKAGLPSGIYLLNLHRKGKTMLYKFAVL